MKVRMIFGTLIDGEDKQVDLPCDSTQDLPKAVAEKLIKDGRAEAIDTKAQA